MKKVMYLFVIFMFSAFLLNAANVEEKKEEVNALKIVKIEKVSEVIKDGIVYATYTGRCLDGTTFTFEADNRDEGQAYVNGYCRGLRDAETTE
ncbi:hypothetical protein IMCC3317_33020 [Kordia antarctica]|uniref:Peptidylprolyl isomerase n=1 Tax=Kordia antarctica TaxID=1218801 RepID=A0A7L4ZNA5_9FLAO|nr:hypothetical protein [Kordia antarctica]QHI37919.1 hypothetical protein IMCC3317_33020 [Kordia antarctica]